MHICEGSSISISASGMLCVCCSCAWLQRATLKNHHEQVPVFHFERLLMDDADPAEPERFEVRCIDYCLTDDCPQDLTACCQMIG
jgi:hypothetical protein